MAHHDVGGGEHRGLIDPLLEVHIARQRAQLRRIQPVPDREQDAPGQAVDGIEPARNTDGAIDM